MHPFCSLERIHESGTRQAVSEIGTGTYVEFGSPGFGGLTVWKSRVSVETFSNEPRALLNNISLGQPVPRFTRIPSMFRCLHTRSFE